MHRQGTEFSMVLNEAFLPLLAGLGLTITFSIFIFLFVKIKKKVAVILLVLALVISICLTIFFAISGWNEYSHYNEKNIEVVHATITMKHKETAGKGVDYYIYLNNDKEGYLIDSYIYDQIKEGDKIYVRFLKVSKNDKRLINLTDENGYYFFKIK
jgi:hypothetical protein